MAQLPTGTVTFLFTDIEGSTRLLSEAADAYRTLLDDHRRLIRNAVEHFGGAIFGTEGDAVFAAFDRALAALAAAADAQRALREHPWPANRQVRVRAGVHSGEVTLTDGDYVGLALHEVARISAAAHGGQILVSGTTRELAKDAGLPAVELRDLGEHRLKDVSHPVRVYQLVGDGLLDQFPPPRTLESRPNNLPKQLTSFIDRRELDEGRRLLAGTRLLTLTGAGGTGKTRLALQIAAEASDEAPDGQVLGALVGIEVDPHRVEIDSLMGVDHLALLREAGRAPDGHRLDQHRLLGGQLPQRQRLAAADVDQLEGQQRIRIGGRVRTARLRTADRLAGGGGRWRAGRSGSIRCTRTPLARARGRACGDQHRDAGDHGNCAFMGTSLIAGGEERM